MESLFKRIDNSGIVAFRIVFGIIIFIETSGALITGWVYDIFIEPKYVFNYISIEWLKPLQGNGMYFYYATMALLGLAIASGLFYRLSSVLFAFMWWGSYLMQKAHYNNHYYLMLLLAFLLIFIPSHKRLSLDVKIGMVTEEKTCSAWCHYILVFQISIVFIFAGIAKVNPDWLAMKPLSYKFDECSSWPTVGALFRSDLMKYLIFYGGLCFDLFIVPLLLWSKTRKYAVVLAIFFNLFNAIVFQVGTFPFLMIGALVLYFPPSAITQILFNTHTENISSLKVEEKGTAIAYILMVYALIQIYLPLRHWHYEGDVNWNEEGYSMAWRMMLNSKHGDLSFIIKDAKGRMLMHDYPQNKISIGQYNSMCSDPDMIWQYVQYLKQEMEEKGEKSVQIFADSHLSLNGRDLEVFIDPKADLAQVTWHHFKHSDWIIPLRY
ncbi:MAG: HTTM domain-containing protein [Sporocytophaga sp.]|uniref:HTTM domain-containing protein n=1 Tax=Sporocytophaga sp. TaxID=2231183 RepID=UPI001AFCD628|nr:HTTM domain-containing protein [Sporocytophaga sp.]MBO9700170.1 HTTM domain-containing protein [Sporocytophaga sp.]